jgi:hypothetical protein
MEKNKYFNNIRLKEYQDNYMEIDISTCGDDSLIFPLIGISFLGGG